MHDSSPADGVLDRHRSRSGKRHSALLHSLPVSVGLWGSCLRLRRRTPKSAKRLRKSVAAARRRTRTSAADRKAARPNEALVGRTQESQGQGEVRAQDLGTRCFRRFHKLKSYSYRRAHYEYHPPYPAFHRPKPSDPRSGSRRARAPRTSRRAKRERASFIRQGIGAGRDQPLRVFRGPRPAEYPRHYGQQELNEDSATLAVSNTPLISNLAFIGRSYLLHEQFGDIWIPEAVRTELLNVPDAAARQTIHQTQQAGLLKSRPASDANLVSPLLWTFTRERPRRSPWRWR